MKELLQHKHNNQIEALLKIRDGNLIQVFLRQKFPCTIFYTPKLSNLLCTVGLLVDAYECYIPKAPVSDLSRIIFHVKGRGLLTSQSYKKFHE